MHILDTRNNLDQSVSFTIFLFDILQSNNRINHDHRLIELCIKLNSIFFFAAYVCVCTLSKWNESRCYSKKNCADSKLNWAKFGSRVFIWKLSLCWCDVFFSFIHNFASKLARQSLTQHIRSRIYIFSLQKKRESEKNINHIIIFTMTTVELSGKQPYSKVSCQHSSCVKSEWMREPSRDLLFVT